MRAAVSPFLRAVRPLLVFALVFGAVVAAGQAVGAVARSLRPVAEDVAGDVASCATSTLVDALSRAAVEQPDVEAKWPGWSAETEARIEHDAAPAQRAWYPSGSAWIGSSTTSTVLSAALLSDGNHPSAMLRRLPSGVNEFTIRAADGAPVCSFDEHGVSHHAADPECAKLLLDVISAMAAPR